MKPPSALLRLDNVGKSFPGPRGAVKVLHDIDIEIYEGDFVAITGPSGSGKTTFLNLAGLMDRPTSGRLTFDETDIGGLSERRLSAFRKTRVGMVFQKFNLLPHRSALQNVQFRFRYVDGSAGKAAARHEHSLAALESVGMAHLRHQPARLLSGGEMQRVAIARAVALRPRLLLADEPTGNLDHESARIVMEIFQTLNREEGITVLLATHNLDLLPYASRHIVFENGRSREADPADPASMAGTEV